MKRKAALVLALAIAISACGGSNGDESVSAAPLVVQAEQEQPATLDTTAASQPLDTMTADTTTADTAAADSGGSVTAQAGTDGVADATDEERALDFVGCMRDNGVDFPDPAIGADGSVDLLGNASPGSLNPNSAGFAAAVDVCGEIVAGASFLPGAAVDESQQQETLLAFAGCLRGLGYDVIDPVLSDVQAGGPGALSRAFGESFNPGDPANAGAVQQCQAEIQGSTNE